MPELSPMTRDGAEPGLEALRAELAETRRQLAEAQEVIRAIQSGDVDALVVSDQVYTLRGAEAPYRTLVEAMSEGAAGLEADGNMLYCNQALADLVGTPLEKMIGRSAYRLVDENFKPMLNGLMEQALRGEPATAEIELMGENGHRHIPVHLSFSRIPSGEIGGICMVVTDLTERMEREKQIADERQRLFDILETLPVMTCLLTADHKVKFANRMFRERFGESIGRRCCELCFGRSIPCEVCESFTPLETGEAQRWEVKGLDGSVFEAHHLPFIDFDGTPLILEMDIDITERRRVRAETEEQREQMRSLAVGLQHAREDERARVARDLHDDIGQILTAIRMELNWIERRLISPSEEMTERLKSAIDLTGKTVTAVRRVCSELRPAILDDLGLAAAIEWHANEFSSRTGILCEVSVPARKLRLEPATATAVFRICQEALTNIMRHAQAQNVGIYLYEQNGNACLRVEDDGKGFREEEYSGSLGLLGMKERARDCGGELQIESSPGKGTTITLEVPKSL
jgi:PAS domain S-box-containing protein